MRVLLDTDVVLDLVGDRQPFVVEASVLLLAHEQGQIEAFVSAITPVNVFYILRKQRGAVGARQAVDTVLTTFSICSIDQSMLTAAHALPMSDFEDALQVAVAQAAALDAVITRNTDDYTHAPILVLSPAEALKRIVSP